MIGGDGVFTSAWRWKISVLPVVVIFTSLGCHRVKEPLSSFQLSDVSASNQLLSGFWWLESNSWRWTAREFSAALLPPDNAEGRGATLHLHLFIPDSQIQLLGPMTLTARIDGSTLPSETFSQGGSYTFTREIPKELLVTSILPVKFSFDKACPPEKSDGRELAAIVSGIELQAN
jgi:hypothetical protein